MLPAHAPHRDHRCAWRITWSRGPSSSRWIRARRSRFRGLPRSAAGARGASAERPCTICAASAMPSPAPRTSAAWRCQTNRTRLELGDVCRGKPASWLLRRPWSTRDKRRTRRITSLLRTRSERGRNPRSRPNLTDPKTSEPGQASGRLAAEGPWTDRNRLSDRPAGGSLSRPTENSWQGPALPRRVLTRRRFIDCLLQCRASRQTPAKRQYLQANHSCLIFFSILMIQYVNR